jgi:hypothetical protein
MNELNHLSEELQKKFTSEGTIPIFYPDEPINPKNLKMNDVITGKENASEIEPIKIDCMDFQHYINLGKVQLNLRGMTDVYFYEVIKKYKEEFSGKSVACIGTGAIWYAGVLCANKIYPTVIDDYYTCHNSGLDLLTFQEYDENPRLFDVIFSFSHVAQEGLGLLDASIDPDGDLKAMNKLMSMLNEDGMLFLSVPVGLDNLIWGKHRTYGSKRFSQLFDGWRVFQYYGCTPEDLEVRDASRVFEPIIALKPLKNKDSYSKIPLRAYKHFIKKKNDPEEKLPAVEEILQNRMILCTGSAYKNRNQLIRTAEFDAKQIPFKKIFASVDDPKNLDVKFRNAKSHLSLIPAIGTQFDGINCIIDSIKNAVNDPESLDDDIIVFRHESLFIYDMNLVRRAVGKFTQGYNVVARFFACPIKSFYVTGSFFLRVSAARPIFKDQPFVTKFNKNDPYGFCEGYFTKYLVNRIKNQFLIHVDHQLHGESELGFYHYPSGYRIPDVYRMTQNPDNIYNK